MIGFNSGTAGAKRLRLLRTCKRSYVAVDCPRADRLSRNLRAVEQRSAGNLPLIPPVQLPQRRGCELTHVRAAKLKCLTLSACGFSLRMLPVTAWIVPIAWMATTGVDIHPPPQTTCNLCGSATTALEIRLASARSADVRADLCSNAGRLREKSVCARAINCDVQTLTRPQEPSRFAPALPLLKLIELSHGR